MTRIRGVFMVPPLRSPASQRPKNYKLPTLRCAYAVLRYPRRAGAVAPPAIGSALGRNGGVVVSHRLRSRDCR